MNHLLSSSSSSTTSPPPPSTKGKSAFRKPQQELDLNKSNNNNNHIVPPPDDKLISDYNNDNNNNSLLSPESSPLSCHPTDPLSARPPRLSQQEQSHLTENEVSYNRTMFKNSRGTRLSFQTESRTYNRRVSFDSTTSLNASDQQHVVLRQASDGFERTRRSRTFLIPVNMDIEVFDGVKFTLMDLADQSDEIIAVGIYTQDQDISAQTKADELMKKIMEYHQGDKISMTVEVYSGKSAKKVLEEMMDIYEPSMMIVASHKRITKSSHEFSGTGIFKGALKRCMIPTIFVPTQTYIRRASTGDIFTRQHHPSIISQDEVTAPEEAARPAAAKGRSASDPQVKVLSKQQRSKPSRLRSSVSLRFIAKMMTLFKKKYKIDKPAE